MGRFHYYSPGLLGLLLGLVLGYNAGAGLGLRPFLTFVAVPLATGIDLGLTCQLAMLGFQGLLAGVLPVPIGKTLRGTICHVIGLLVIFGLLTRLGLSLAHSHLGLVTLTYQLGLGVVAAWAVVGLGSLMVALVLYLFSIPTAAADFPKDD